MRLKLHVLHLRALPHAIFTKVQIELYRSYHFIAISTSYLNAAGLLDKFLQPL